MESVNVIVYMLQPAVQEIVCAYKNVIQTQVVKNTDATIIKL